MARRSNAWSRLGVRLVRSAGVLLILVLLYDGLRFSQAWFEMYLTIVDAKSSISAVIEKSPTNRLGAADAARAACAKRGTTLEAYDQQVTEGSLGRLITADITMSHPVEGAFLTPLMTAAEQDGTLSTWLTKRPVVRFTWHQSFQRIE